MMVHRDHAEEVVVGLSDGLAGPVPIDVAWHEVLEIAAEGAVVRGHGGQCSTGQGGPSNSVRSDRHLRQPNEGILWLRIGTFLLEGSILSLELHRVGDEEFWGIALPGNAFIERLPEIERELGWADG